MNWRYCWAIDCQARKVCEMPDPTHEQLIHDVEQIILELESDNDIREWPDTHRRGNFLAGWRAAAEQVKIIKPEQELT
jgi:hypothetical protein